MELLPYLELTHLFSDDHLSLGVHLVGINGLGVVVCPSASCSKRVQYCSTAGRPLGFGNQERERP